MTAQTSTARFPPVHRINLGVRKKENGRRFLALPVFLCPAIMEWRVKIIQEESNVRTSGQVDPKLNIIKNKPKTVIPFIIDGCTVSFTSTPKEKDDTIKTIKEILLSAYKTKTARS